MEKKTQSKLIQYLKSKGCYVVKLRPGLGVPVGCPDVLALYEGFWAVFECKSGAKAPFQALQEETLAKLGNWSFARVVTPDNIDQIIAELEVIL